uniref:Peptidase S1 domain-containing protein n=1 Tax=Anopheles farauti TaxID=69004 RepID=A0A182QSM1_9DIPT
MHKDTASGKKILAMLSVISQDECTERLRHNKQLNSTLLTNVLCTIDDAEDDICHSYSGGPMLRLHNSRMYVVGVVSVGTNCGMSGAPGLSTKVFMYKDWILAKTRLTPKLTQQRQSVQTSNANNTSTTSPTVAAPFNSDNIPDRCGMIEPVWRVSSDVEDEGNRHVWAVFLEILKANSNSKGRCVGTLIHERFVLTAAHCLHTRVENVKLFFGVNLLSELGNGGTQNRTAAEFIIHHDYNSHTSSHDIALIRVDEPVITGASTGIIPACLPTNKIIEENYRTDSTGRCVGTLIHELFVLTAAHCFDTPNESVSLYFGVNSLNQLTECLTAGSCQNRTAAGVIIHRDYNSYTLANDIALVLLDKPVTFEMGFIPACLPLGTTFKESAFDDPHVVSIGWGETSNGSLSDSKTLVVLHKLTQDDCEEQLMKLTNTITLANIVCTVNESGENTCLNDSGEPTLQLYRNRMYLIGVASYGPKCGETPVPKISTKVSVYTDWILTHMENKTAWNMPTSTTTEAVAVTTRSKHLESTLPEGCGVVNPVSRVASDAEDDNHIHHWAVYLEIIKSSNFTGRCVGTLIHERFVLTAAHCLHTRVENVKLYFGVNLLSELDDGATQNRTAIEFIIHHNYNSHTLSNDIALIRLNEPVFPEMNIGINAACLPLNDTLPSGLAKDPSVLSLGWGKNSQGLLSDRKLVVMLRVLTQDECAEQLQNNTRFHSTNFSNVVCTVGMQRGQDVCQGDSGAPILQLVGLRFYVIGVVSFGPKCGMVNIAPSVSTNVSMYMDWILTKINDEESNELV